MMETLIEEAAKKSGLVWVRGPAAAAQAVWHIWSDGAVVVVGDGPGEQPLAGLSAGGTATVTVPSKDKGSRLVTFPATVRELEPHSDAWVTSVEELKGKRLNAPDAETMTERWARECRVLRLEPSGPAGEAPGSMPDHGGAAVPPVTTATTRNAVPKALPRLLFSRRKK